MSKTKNQPEAAPPKAASNTLTAAAARLIQGLLSRPLWYEGGNATRLLISAGSILEDSFPSPLPAEGTVDLTLTEPQLATFKACVEFTLKKGQLMVQERGEGRIGAELVALAKIVEPTDTAAAKLVNADITTAGAAMVQHVIGSAGWYGSDDVKKAAKHYLNAAAILAEYLPDDLKPTGDEEAWANGPVTLALPESLRETVKVCLAFYVAKGAIGPSKHTSRLMREFAVE